MAELPLVHTLWLCHLFQLLTTSIFRRFAILDGPTMPIVGEGEEEANDRYENEF